MNCYVLLYQDEEQNWIAESPHCPDVTPMEWSREGSPSARKKRWVYIEALEQDNLPVPEEYIMANPEIITVEMMPNAQTSAHIESLAD